MEIILVFVILALLIIIPSIYMCKKQDAEYEDLKYNNEINNSYYQQWLTSNNLPDKPHFTFSSNGIEIFIYIDENESKFFIWENEYFSHEKNAYYLSDVRHNCYCINFCDLLKVETVVKQKNIGPNAGDVIVGGMIAGNVGVATSLLKENKEIVDYKICIYTSNILDPVIDIHLINYASNAAKATPENYAEADEFSHKIEATINAIISKQTK